MGSSQSSQRGCVGRPRLTEGWDYSHQMVLSACAAPEVLFAGCDIAIYLGGFKFFGR
jgi:hypothetical protein